MPNRWSNAVSDAVNTKTDTDVALLLLRQKVRDSEVSYSESDLIDAIDRCEAALKALKVAVLSAK